MGGADSEMSGECCGGGGKTYNSKLTSGTHRITARTYNGSTCLREFGFVNTERKLGRRKNAQPC